MQEKSFQKLGWDMDLGQYLGLTEVVVLETQVNWFHGFGVTTWYKDIKPRQMEKKTLGKKKESRSELTLVTSPARTFAVGSHGMKPTKAIG